MIHVVDKFNYPSYRSLIEDSFRLRYKVFVEEKKWTALEREDKRDIDQFDTENAVYHLCLDPEGQVVGVQRMLASTGPHLLSDVLPELCEGERPVGEHIWEWTRYAVDPRQRREPGRFLSPAAMDLLVGMVEWGLANKIDTFIIQMNQHWLLRLMQFHFRMTPLGFPKDMNSETIIAVTAGFNSNTLAKLREVRGSDEPVLVHLKSPDDSLAA
jgi:acyl-homoserine lactone synthase